MRSNNHKVQSNEFNLKTRWDPVCYLDVFYYKATVESHVYTYLLYYVFMY